MEQLPDLRLPSDLCQQIFNNQFEIDVGNVDEKIISKTIELYVEAMQFFQNHVVRFSDHPSFDIALTQKKKNFYQQKIKKLLSRHEVDDCLIGKKTHKKTLQFTKEITKIHEKVPQQAKLMIQRFNQLHENQENLIHNLINKQSENLNQRIRKRSSSTKKTLNSSKKTQQQKLAKIYEVLNVKMINFG